MHFTKAQRGDNNIVHIDIPLSLPALMKYILVPKTITVVLAHTKYIIYNTPTTPRRPMICPASTCHNSLDLFYREQKMGIFIHTKFALPLEFKFNSNAPTFSLIGLEL